ncbi:MAG: hypothetical protein ABI878_06765 [Acidobacteriota bacterium]
MHLKNMSTGLFVLLTVVCAFFLSACGTSHVGTYPSPDSRFRVDLADDNNIIGKIVGGEKTLFSLYEGENIVVKDEVLMWRDYPAVPVTGQYPGSSWISDSTFRLEDLNRLETSETDKLIINNKSGKPIKFLVIQLGDFMIVPNIAPDERRTLEVRRTGFSWLAVHGKFDDGQEVGRLGVDFFRRDKVIGTVTYCVKALDSGFDIGSLNIVGYKSGTDVPRLQNCD